MEYYCDASYSPQHQVGVIGFKRNDTRVMTKPTEKKGSTNCELEAFLAAIEYAKIHKDLNVIVYTDCNKVIQLVNDRNRWNKTYREFYDRYDQFLQSGIVISAIKIKGHSPTRIHTSHDTQFKLIDKGVRKSLRDYIDILSG